MRRDRRGSPTQARRVAAQRPSASSRAASQPGTRWAEVDASIALRRSASLTRRRPVRIDPTSQAGGLVVGMAKTALDHRHLRDKTEPISPRPCSRRGYRVVGAYRRTSALPTGRLGGARHRRGRRVCRYGAARGEQHPARARKSSSLTRSITSPRKASSACRSINLSAPRPQITGVGALNLLEAIRIVDRSIRFSIRRPLRKCSAKSRPFRKRRTRRSIRAARMGWRSFSRIGQRSTIASRTISSVPAASCSITSRRYAGFEFVTRKITFFSPAARIKAGKLDARARQSRRETRLGLRT